MKANRSWYPLYHIPQHIPLELSFHQDAFVVASKRRDKSMRASLGERSKSDENPCPAATTRYRRSIESLLSPRECAAWIRYGEDEGFERSFHTQTSEIAHRDNGRITLHSAEVAAAIFARVGPFVPTEMDGRWEAPLTPLACKRQAWATVY